MNDGKKYTKTSSHPFSAFDHPALMSFLHSASNFFKGINPIKNSLIFTANKHKKCNKIYAMLVKWPIFLLHWRPVVRTSDANPDQWEKGTVLFHPIGFDYVCQLCNIANNCVVSWRLWLYQNFLSVKIQDISSSLFRVSDKRVIRREIIFWLIFNPTRYRCRL